MSAVINVFRMDMAICKKSMMILIVSMLAAGVGCLFFLTPLLLSFFVVGSTTVVSAIFAVESKSNMEIFYGCFPIQKWEYVVGRSLSSFIVMAIPALICIIFMQIEIRLSLCRIEEVKLIMETVEPYQMLITCAMIMLGFIGGANLLLASFSGKLESREMLEVILLLIEALLAGAVMFLFQKIAYHGDMQEFMNVFSHWILNHKGLSCTLFLLIGLIVLIAAAVISIKIVPKISNTLQ